MYHIRSSVSEAGPRLKLKDSCISQLKVQGPSGTCNESQEDEKRKNRLTEVGRSEGTLWHSGVQVYLTECIYGIVLESQLSFTITYQDDKLVIKLTGVWGR